MAGEHRFDLTIADSSALIALATCDALGFLDRVSRRVRAPTAVFREVIVEGKAEAGVLRSYLSNKVEPVELDEIVIETGTLGRGEFEALALFRKLRADVLLSDDRRARKVARHNRIPVVGSLGVLVLAKRRGWLVQLRPRLEILQKSSLFFSDKLIERALELADEVSPRDH